MSNLSNNSAIFRKRTKIMEPFNKNLIGQVYLQMLVSGDKEFNCSIGNVTKKKAGQRLN